MKGSGYVSKYYTMEDLGDFPHIVELGDLVEFDRVVFQHWGVYYGGRKRIVVHMKGRHFSGVDFGSSVPYAPDTPPGVCRISLKDVAEDCRFRINNSLDKRRAPNSLPDMRESLDNAVKQYFDKDYDVLSSNCEHFAKLMRYGEPTSGQVNTFLTALGVAGVAMAGGLIIGKLLNNEKSKKK